MTEREMTPRRHQLGSDLPFRTLCWLLAASYVLLIAAIVVVDFGYTSLARIGDALASPEIRFAVVLSLVSCTITALLSVLVAIPSGYLLARSRSRFGAIVDALVDVPIALPPLVIGLSLLILLQTRAGRTFEDAFVWCFDALQLNALLSSLGWPVVRGITYQIPAVILAQFAVACAFAIRTMRLAFDQLDPRREQVALTLGCRESQAFFRVVLPEVRTAVVAAGCLAWARALGEFGPILVFAGATRRKTEVMPTTVFLELSVGDLESAVAVSLMMIVAALTVLTLARGLLHRRVW